VQAVGVDIESLDVSVMNFRYQIVEIERTSCVFTILPVELHVKSQFHPCGREGIGIELQAGRACAIIGFRHNVTSM
jgi:hypothetical protein